MSFIFTTNLPETESLVELFLRHAAPTLIWRPTWGPQGLYANNQTYALQKMPPMRKKPEVSELLARSRKWFGRLSPTCKDHGLAVTGQHQRHPLAPNDTAADVQRRSSRVSANIHHDRTKSWSICSIRCTRLRMSHADFKIRFLEKFDGLEFEPVYYNH